MKHRFKYSAIIERYLSNEMAYGEMRSFEKEVGINPALLAEFEFTKNIDEVLKCDEIIDLRQKLMIARQESGKAKADIPIIQLQRKRIWYAAATLLVLATIGSALFLNITGKYSNETLFNKYYSSENIIDVTRSGDANIVEAIIKFQEKDYQSSANLFGQILEKDTNNFAGWFFYGISNIENENFDKAEAAFKQIINNNQNLYVEHAEWYLGLCYLKSNQSVKAKAQLNKIASNSENFHFKEAKNLLEKLSN